MPHVGLIRHEIADLVRCPIALAEGFDNSPEEGALRRLQNTCELLDAISAFLQRELYIVGAYRKPALNRRFPTLTTPDHAIGAAADIHAEGLTPLQLAKALVPLVSVIGIGQLSLEHDGLMGQWVHVGSSHPDKPSHRIITETRDGIRLGIQAL